jgi:hypothetical protein
MNPLLEHAARVLEHQPTRCMQARLLHRRTIRENGVDVSFLRFMEAVGRRPDHFAVIPPDPVVGAAAAWDPRHRCLYEAAMEAAGMTQPLIVLAERRVPSDEAAGAGPDPDAAPAGRIGPATVADVFGDVHEALTHLLHAAEPDDGLHTAVTGALEELHAAQRLLT